jgi:putative sterol carrier protein
VKGDTMSSVIDTAVEELNAKLGDDGFDGTAKFVIEEEGSIIIDENGARAADDEAEVTLTADADTFKSILDGELDATAAFMSGRLSVDGDMGKAMQLGTVLA